ncbi:MAG: PilZ domain-containing protein [Candidatus Aureabacteria bacterium]|nr:PilZ domain-containing protein [Candidatus Auribacterota bacterium]
MIRKIFRKKKDRLKREDVELSCKYQLSFDKDEIIDFNKVTQRAIIEDMSKNGMKFTVTPIFDKGLIKKIKKSEAFLFFELYVPPDKIAVNGLGILRWVKNDMNRFPAVTLIGINFIDISMEEKVIINRFIVQKKREKQ